MELVPIRVKIGLKVVDGKLLADYPDFNQLQCVINAGMDWSYYVDTYGLGWHYDKKCGHKDDELDSPRGFQLGVLLIPKVFAQEALAMYPTLITELTEIELEDFYDNRAHAHEPDETITTDIIMGIKAKQDLGQPLTAWQLSALNPNDDTPGIVKNVRKKWTDFKAKEKVTIASAK